ncbi:unnamed protein product [Dibothriocephalus latus]|uniref:Serine-threonine/tyrosine-protein kinase catalytic domain-containing protein n=1 Tax=Dibothriocephalus latus TaxID=60516 RepID=A0A3P6PFT0_DIBLA|nr:unnamed protein product [Dibothriocephalus latus]
MCVPLQPLTVVCEYMPRGDLNSCLRRFKAAEDSGGREEGALLVDRLLYIAVDITEAMIYLGYKSYVHSRRVPGRYQQNVGSSVARLGNRMPPLAVAAYLRASSHCSLSALHEWPPQAAVMPPAIVSCHHCLSALRLPAASRVPFLLSCLEDSASGGPS